MTSARRGQPTQASRKSGLERVIDTLATGLGASVGWMAERGVLFLLFAALWFGLGATLVLSPATIDELWQAIGNLPLVVQVVLWLLFLPVMAGLWVWETTWPALVRLVIFLALAAWTLLIFRPKWLHRPAPNRGNRTGGNGSEVHE